LVLLLYGLFCVRVTALRVAHRDEGTNRSPTGTRLKKVILFVFYGTTARNANIVVPYCYSLPHKIIYAIFLTRTRKVDVDDLKYSYPLGTEGGGQIIMPLGVLGEDIRR